MFKNCLCQTNRQTFSYFIEMDILKKIMLSVSDWDITNKCFNWVNQNLAFPSKKHEVAKKKTLLPGTLMVQIQQLMGAATMQGLQHCQ